MFTFHEYSSWRFRQKTGWDEDRLYSNMFGTIREILDFRMNKSAFLLSMGRPVGRRFKVGFDVGVASPNLGVSGSYSSIPVEDLGARDAVSGATYDDWNALFPDRQRLIHVPPPPDDPPFCPSNDTRVVTAKRLLSADSLLRRVRRLQTHDRPASGARADYFGYGRVGIDGVELAHLHRLGQRAVGILSCTTPWRLAGSALSAQAQYVAGWYSAEAHVSTREYLVGVRLMYDMDRYWSFGGEAYYTAAGSGGGALSLGARYSFDTHPLRFFSFVEEAGAELQRAADSEYEQRRRSPSASAEQPLLPLDSSMPPPPPPQEPVPLAVLPASASAAVAAASQARGSPIPLERATAVFTVSVVTGHSDLTYAVPLSPNIWLASRYRFNVNSLASSFDAGFLYRRSAQQIVRARISTEDGLIVQVHGRILRGLVTVGLALPLRPSTHAVGLSCEIHALPFFSEPPV